MGGIVHFWDFQSAQNICHSIKASKEMTAFLILDPYPILITGDVNGAIVVWLIDFEHLKVQPLRRLTAPRLDGNTITNICMIDEADVAVDKGEDAAGGNGVPQLVVFVTTEVGEVLKFKVEDIVAGLHVLRKFLCLPSG